MKVLFRKNIRSYSGENEELVYQAFNRGWVCIGRDYVYPVLTDNNHIKGQSVKNLATVFKAASPDYIADLKTYTTRNISDNLTKYDIAPRAFSLFLKMMFAWQASDPTHVDLTAVTIADIVALDADVRTIASAVDAEFLPNVTVSDDLTSEIQ